MKKINNINEFQQFKKSIKNNNKILFVGFDVSKYFSDICITDSNQNILLKKYRFKNDNEGFNRMLSKIYNIKEKTNSQTVFCGFEPTGKYHQIVASFLLANNLPICQISSVIASDNRRSLDGSWRKNDSKDAFNITDLMQRGRFLFYPEADTFYDGLRELMTVRYKVSKLLCSLKPTIRNSFLSVYFPELDKIYSNIFHHEILHLLRNFPTPCDIRKIELNEFVNSFYGNRKMTAKTRDRLIKVWETAQNSVGCKPGTSTPFIAKQILKQIVFYQKILKEIECKIEVLCKSRIDYSLLSSIPGFGPIHSAAFMSCVKDIKNYNSINQIEKLAGFDLEYRESGQYTGTMHISKKGKGFLRFTLCHAAKIALKNKVFKELFLSKLKTKGVTRENKFKLQIKCAEKLLRIAYAVLKSEKPFCIEKMFNYSVKQPVLTNVRAS